MHKDKITILHISDLHRSPDNPIPNISLFTSLVRDIDTYEIDENISKPDLMIVSGDIVQGSNDLTNAGTILQEQYTEALDFLVKMADELFDGDRNKIILVPGNHDVCWSESKDSMKKIEEENILETNGKLKKQIFKEMMKHDSKINWSWEDRSFYKIINQDLYNQRLQYFKKFYQDFYQEKVYSLDPNNQYEIFDFQDFGISIIGFNSCFYNDHLNRAGTINPMCVAQVSSELRRLKKEGRLLLATWHHNTRGEPYSQDYMSHSTLQSFIADDIKIGFHGHQHKSEIIRMENNIIDNNMMIIVSAGSICAAPHELPTGHKQQFNVVELTRKDEQKIEVTIHSREKTLESTFENPIWKKGLFNSISPVFTTQISHQKIEKNYLEEVEPLIGAKEYSKALEILKNLDKNDDFIRIYLLECYQHFNLYGDIIETFIEPRNNNEAISLMNAALEKNDKIIIDMVYNINYIQTSNDPSIKYLKDQLKVKL